MNVNTLLLVLASLFALASGLVYVLSVIRRETKISYVAIAAFTTNVLLSIFVSDLHGGSLALIPGVVESLFLVAALAYSLRFNLGVFLFDIKTAAGIVLIIGGVIVWLTSEQYVVALIAFALAECVAFLFVIVKLLTSHRGSESPTAWGIAGVGFLLPMFTESLTVTNSMFSITTMSLNFLVAGIAFSQQRNDVKTANIKNTDKSHFLV